MKKIFSGPLSEMINIIVDDFVLNIVIVFSPAFALESRNCELELPK